MSLFKNRILRCILYRPNAAIVRAKTWFFGIVLCISQDKIISVNWLILCYRFFVLCSQMLVSIALLHGKWALSSTTSWHVKRKCAKTLENLISVLLFATLFLFFIFHHFYIIDMKEFRENLLKKPKQKRAKSSKKKRFISRVSCSAESHLQRRGWGAGFKIRTY